ncbi:MAG: outer membrane lipoprotein-sorting protein [Chromatiales bacterium]|jgi:hypothetical protein
MSIRYLHILLLLLPGLAAAAQSWPYPEGKLNGEQITQQVYAVSHGKLIDNAMSKQNDKDIAMVVTRVPREKRKPGRRPLVNTFETYGNSTPQNSDIESMQMAIIRSGKAKGTGVLYISYADPDKGGVLSIWLPALRKVRRMNEPAHEDTWSGTNLTYGELVLRRPEHEEHELLEQRTFEDCLLAMDLQKWELNRYTKLLPGPQCGHKGRPVYVVKSTTKFKNWWYDYRISEIDTESFFLYRTLYYKDGKLVKTVVVDWQSLEQPDVRIGYPRYIYAVNEDDGVDSMVFVPRSTVLLNQDVEDSFWSEATLRKYGHR